MKIPLTLLAAKTSSVCTLVAVIGIFALVGMYKLSIHLEEKRREERKYQRIQQAERSYREALAKLSERQDSEWKTHVLELGRHLAALQREYGAATVYDEVSIMNDVNAAIPAPKPKKQATPGREPAPPTETRTLRERLQELKELAEEGLITTADYEARKAEILKEI